MRISELELPKTPEQQRLEQLRANSKRASDALKLERNRQKIQRAQKAMQALSAPAIKNLNPPSNQKETDTNVGYAWLEIRQLL